MPYRLKDHGVVLNVNLPIERHAGKIYITAMFQQFGLHLFESDYYNIKEVEVGDTLHGM
jgi:hypothetical protein